MITAPESGKIQIRGKPVTVTTLGGENTGPSFTPALYSWYLYILINQEKIKQ